MTTLDAAMPDAETRRWARPSFATTALYAFLTIYCLLNLMPLLWMVLASFKTNEEIYSSVLSLPESWSLRNYAAAWGTGGLGSYMLNSVIVTVPTLVIVLTFGSMAAYVLASVWPSRILYGYFVAGIIIPAHVILIPTFILVRALDLTNSLAALVLIYSAGSLPLAVFILVGFMRSIPRELEEAAVIDGAGPATVFFRIILPVSRPGLAVVGTLTFLHCWNEYLFAFVIISERANKTLPQGVYALRGEFTTDYGLLTAGLVISVIPVLVIYVLFQEQFIKGATAGSTVG